MVQVNGMRARVAFVEQRLRGKGKVLDLVAFFERLAERGQAGDPHQVRWGLRFEKSGIPSRRHSPFIRLTKMLSLVASPVKFRAVVLMRASS